MYVRDTKAHIEKDKNRIQTKLYKTMVIPRCLCNSELCEVTARDKSHLQTTDMRFLKSTFAVRRIYKLQNEEIGQNLVRATLNRKCTSTE